MSATTIGPLIGRGPELAQVDALIGSLRGDVEPRTVPHPRALLVAGDAGVGKTTLAHAVLARAGELGLATGEGHCLDLAIGPPFAPISEALRQVVASIKDAGDLVPPPARWLVDDTLVRADALERLIAAAAALAGQRAMVLVIEDLHWSDRSTRDFALSLVRTCRAPILLVVTIRSDDLTVGHPSRPAISELGLSPGAVRLALGPLDAAEIAELAGRLLGHAPSEADLATISSRSGGNPLYVEELMKSSAETVPPSLHDLLLRHVNELPAPAAALVRLACVGGTVIDLDLLHEASGLDAGTFQALAHEAVDAGLFTRHGDQYRFRHALIRDVVAEGLLPSERVALHRGYAEVLRRRCEVGAAAARWRANAALALHAAAAGDPGTALTAHVKSGMAAKQHGAPEAADHLESALGLWRQVPDAADLAGVTDAEVAALAAESLMRSTRNQNERVERLLQDAMRRLDPDTDPLAASRVLTVVARHWRDLDGLMGRQAACDRAIALATGPSSIETSAAWRAKSWLHAERLQYAGALAAANKAIGVARNAGSLAAEYQGRTEAAWSLHELGRLPAARSEWEKAIRLSEQADAPVDTFHAQAGLAWELIVAGRIDDGCALARHSQAAANREGLTRVANLIGFEEVSALTWQGRFEDAKQRLDELIDRGLEQSRSLWGQADLLIALGDLDAALSVEEHSMHAAYRANVLDTVHGLRRVELFEQLGNVARELEVAKAVLGQRKTDSPVQAARRARCGLQALCAAAAVGHPVPPGLAQAAADVFAAAQRGLTNDWKASIFGAHLASAAAYARRLEQQPASEAWGHAAAAAAPFGAYFALRPQLELAREQLTHGQRDAGKESLIALWRSAQSMGAAWFALQAIAEARRHRVPIPASAADAPSARDQLTPREHDVLLILSAGATNRTIAQTLFISERTAARHVSNILAKLGVANRGEAAALVRRTSNA
ncbi:helix-turn-helix transcriptional regulator [Terrabacter sp. 2RAF25]|uniref:helix-turn-helix transcriptional regulator n=1 Tax=Terrabacter sp. 2RAF25 TaxID=3232998 RepID=UPI003F9898B9